MAFDVCLCPDLEHVKKMDNFVDLSIPRCCPNSYLASTENQNLTCLLDPQKSQFCPFHNYYTNSYRNFQVHGDEILAKKSPFFQEETKIDRLKNTHCVATFWNESIRDHS